MTKIEKPVKKLINFDEELYKKISKYQDKHFYPSFTKTVKELIRIGLGEKEPRE